MFALLQDKHSSSSSSHKSSHRDKDRSKDKDREPKREKQEVVIKPDPDADESTVTNGNSSRLEEVHDIKKEEVAVKQEPMEEAESEDEKPLVSCSAGDVRGVCVCGGAVSSQVCSHLCTQAARVKQEPKGEKRRLKEESDDDEPLAARMEKKVKKESKKPAKRKQEDSEFSPSPKKKKSESQTSVKRESTGGASQSTPKKGRKKTEDETQERWKW